MWSSLIGTGTAIIGIIVGIWMYSPAKKYRHAGSPTSIPYKGQKRWHTIFGLVFGLGNGDLGIQRLLVDGSIRLGTEPNEPDCRSLRSSKGEGKGWRAQDSE